MEVVACFLQKYFTLLANNEVDAVKELYAPDAFVSLTINGEAEEAKGNALVEKLAAIFLDGVVTITDVSKTSANEAIVFCATGSVVVNEVETTFTQQVTLFCTAKHWYIGLEQFNIVVPEPEVVEEEPEEEVVPEPVVEKAPTPSKAAKAEKETKVEAKIEKIEKVEPAKEKTAEKPAAVVPTPAPAPKVVVPAGSWAAKAISPSSGPAPKVAIQVTTAPVAAAKPAPVAAEPVGVYFTVTISKSIADKNDVKKLAELVQNEVVVQIEKCGLSKKDTTRIHPVPKDFNKFNVFIDFIVPNALEKLIAGKLSIFGVPVTPTLQNKK